MLEMSLLAKLRHPNLVLFIGVCYDSATNRPTTILTELMPTSLYNILEDLSVKLGLADILDIAHDVATGIDYLHSHSPIITHRDISSKNILVGGNRFVHSLVFSLAIYLRPFILSCSESSIKSQNN